MASFDRTNVSRRLILSAAVVAALAVAAAMTPVARTVDAPAAEPTHPGAGSMVRAAAGSQSSCSQENCVFLLDKGRFTQVPRPGNDPGDNIIRINNRSEIVGSYADGAGGFHGFLLDRRGRSISIDFPGAAGTQAFDVNDRGWIVGIYNNTNSTPSGADDTRIFLRDERGRFTTIAIPGAVQMQGFGINNRGDVVGEYLDRDGKFHGFRWAHGRITRIDVPGSAGTTAFDINERGEVVGLHVDELPPTGVHGFLLSSGVYTSFDDPPFPSIFAVGINNRGQIAGAASNGPGTNFSGFVLARGVNGPLTPIAFPGASGTGASGINDRGQIVGGYILPSTAQGKVGTASPQ
jgi:probable HAF family extracellular repeat protein